jgi:hypothetical protein
MTSITRWTLRLVGAVMLGWTAGIHAYLLHDQGYNVQGHKILGVHAIGGGFLLLVIVASALCLAVVFAPKRILGRVAVVGALTEAATFAALIFFTHHTLFGFQDSSHAPKYHESLYVEAAGFIVLLALTGLTVLTRNRDR